MPVMNEWEKSLKLTNDLRANIVAASIKFCFLPLSEIFEELYTVLAWDLYFDQTPEDLFSLYEDNKTIMGHLIEESDTFSIKNMGTLPVFRESGYNYHQQRVPKFPYALPILAKNSMRHSQHSLQVPEEGTNKKERAFYTRYIQLQKDIKIFGKKIQIFQQELNTALNSYTTTKQFIDQNPEFEGYMKQSLKKFYNDKHPNVIDSLNSAMNVRTYASLTSGHRLQAYQTSMLAQLQQLEPRHTPLLMDSAQV